MVNKLTKLICKIIILILISILVFVVSPRLSVVQAYDLQVPSTEYPNISSAINSASSGDTIKVASGTYNELIILKKGISIQGAGANTTFINGGGLGSVVTAIRVDETTKLEGFTITNGSGTMVNNKRYGGGVYCSNASPKISNCIIDNNKADWGGGISNLDNSLPSITLCKFDNNTATKQGGGIYNRNSSPYMDMSQFNNNKCFSTNGGGGGISNDWQTNAVTSNCLFYGNTAYDDGGGMYNADSNPTVINCKFLSNVCGDSGGGMRNTRASSKISDCVFGQGNEAMWGGG